MFRKEWLRTGRKAKRCWFKIGTELQWSVKWRKKVNAGTKRWISWNLQQIADVRASR